MNRRSLLSGLPVAAGAIMLPFGSGPGLNRTEQIRHHVTALLDLIRADLPDDISSLSANVIWSEGDPSVSVTAMRREWVDDSRGARWVERNVSPDHPMI